MVGDKFNIFYCFMRNKPYQNIQTVYERNFQLFFHGFVYWDYVFLHSFLEKLTKIYFWNRNCF